MKYTGYTIFCLAYFAQYSSVFLHVSEVYFIFLLSCIPLYNGTTISLSILLACFQCLTITNEATVSMYKPFCGHKFLFFMWKYPRDIFQVHRIDV